jgi:hypothetical protein
MSRCADPKDAGDTLETLEPYTDDEPAPSLERLAAMQMVIESALDMHSSDGGTIEVWTIGATDLTVRATAPRLAVREDIELIADLLLHGLPYRVTTRVVEAGYRSPTRAALVLEVIDVSPTDSRRFEHRTPVATHVSMVARDCERLMDETQMDTVAVDLSQSGIGISCLDARVRPGDVFDVHCRFIGGTVDQRVRVERTTSFDTGQRIIGCTFLHANAASHAVINRILTRDEDSPVAD